MGKLKAAFGSIVNTKNSETYAFWGSLAVGILGHVFPTQLAAADQLSQSVFGVPLGVFLSSIFGYAIMRMTSKGVKSEAVPAAPPTVGKVG